MLGGDRLRASGVAVAVPLLAIAALAALAYSGRAGAGRDELSQVGEETFLDPLTTATPSDMAATIQGILKKEAVLLKKIGERAKLRQHVQIDVTAGQLGIVGPKGYQGYTGVRGFQGPRGNTGQKGPQGPRGIQGPRGMEGVKGTDGSSGKHGSTGDDGATGPAGPTCRQGLSGPRGGEGNLGKNGPNGKPGTAGPQVNRGRQVWLGSPGPPGKKGPPGSPGRAGDPGAPGDRGDKGLQGLVASNGPTGIPGPPGRPGKSVCSTGNMAGQRMCCGKVPAKEWVRKSAYTSEATIDMGKCGFVEAPMIFSSIDSKSEGSRSLNTESNIINTSPDTLDPGKARVNIRTSVAESASAFNKMQTGEWNWVLNWCAYGVPAATKKLPTYEVCCGQSDSNWKQNGAGLLKLDVDTSGCGWDNGPAGAPNRPPVYFTTATDTTCGNELFTSTPRCASRTEGYQSIYSKTSKSFSTYMRPLPGGNLPVAAKAKEYNWKLNWCAVKPYVPNKNAAAGFPCTNSRLLKGAGNQDTFTDFGSMCCDTSTSGGWRAAGGDSITKTLDISQCKFKKISYLMTNIRGDGPVSEMTGATGYSPTTDGKYKIYVNTGGKYKFYNAAQYHFRIQWCAYGR